NHNYVPRPKDIRIPVRPIGAGASQRVAKTLPRTYADRIMKPTARALISNLTHDEGRVFVARSIRISSGPAYLARHHTAQRQWPRETADARHAPAVATNVCADADPPPSTHDEIED